MTQLSDRELGSVVGGLGFPTPPPIGPKPPKVDCGDRRSWQNAPGFGLLTGGGVAPLMPIIPCRDTKKVEPPKLNLGFGSRGI